LGKSTNESFNLMDSFPDFRTSKPVKNRATAERECSKVENEIYESILTRWRKTGILAFCPTSTEWRSRFIQTLKKEKQWQEEMLKAFERRGRPAGSFHKDDIKYAFKLAKNDALKLLYIVGVPLEWVFQELEYSRYIYDQAYIENEIFRSKTHRGKAIEQIRGAIPYITQAELFTFQQLRSIDLQKEAERRKVSPPPTYSAEWLEFIISILENIQGNRIGGPTKKENVRYLEHVLLRGAKQAIDESNKINDDEMESVRESIKAGLRPLIRTITRIALSEYKKVPVKPADRRRKEWSRALAGR
jgi:predicted transcriptional regulator